MVHFTYKHPSGMNSEKWSGERKRKTDTHREKRECVSALGVFGGVYGTTIYTVTPINTKN